MKKKTQGIKLVHLFGVDNRCVELKKCSNGYFSVTKGAIGKKAVVVFK